ncbi:MAG: hypothetical protein HRU14_12830, partial [Planctomycetes bacterium]|nr:hypothetical protein [Planctomycetota bacterium]
MTKVVVLMGCLVAASAAALTLKWDDLFGESDPDRTASKMQTSSAPPLPDVVQEKIPIHAILARPRSGAKSNL